MPTVLINNILTTFGPLLVGCCMDILLQGILFVQFATYFQHYHDDRLLLKLAVAGLVLFTTLKSCQSFGMLWVSLLEAFGDPDLAIKVYCYHWTIVINPLAVAGLGSYVRVYFCYRLYFISKAWWAVALVASTDMISLCFIIAAAYLESENSKMVLYFTLHFSIVFAGDMLLTLLTAFFLIRHKKDVLPRAHGAINALIRLTFETAAPGAVCSLLNLTVSLVPVYYTLLSTFNEVLPKLYAVSMMWTLNSRQELRDIPWGNSSTLSRRISSGMPQLSIRGPIQIQTVHHENEESEFPQLSNGVQTQKDTYSEDSEEDSDVITVQRRSNLKPIIPT